MEAGSEEETTRAALRQLLSSQSGHTACGGERAKQIGTNIISSSDKYIFQFPNQSGHTHLAHSGERAEQVQPVRGCICPQEGSQKTQERSEQAYMYVQFHSAQPFVHRSSESWRISAKTSTPITPENLETNRQLQNSNTVCFQFSTL